MIDAVIKDYSQVDWNNPEHVKQFNGALKFYLAAPDLANDLANVQAFTTKGDFPAELKEEIRRFVDADAYDEGWQKIFDVIDFTGTNKDGFYIQTAGSGLAFLAYLSGEVVKVDKVYGDRATVSFVRYGGALGFDNEWFEDNSFWLINDTAREFRIKAFKKRAEYHYALIEAVGAGQNITWQAVTPASVANTNENYNAIRDMNTANAAAQSLVGNLKDKGIGVTPQSKFVILYPYQLRSRIQRMLGVLHQAISGPQSGTVYNFEAIETTMMVTTSVYYVIQPKAKIMSGIRKNLEVRTVDDWLRYAQTVAAWQRFGAAIGDAEQVQRCAIS